MNLWPEETKRRLSEIYTTQAAVAQGFINYAEKMIEGEEALDIPRLLSWYLNGVCSWVDDLSREACKVINRVGVSGGYLPPAGSFFNEGMWVKPNLLGFLAPEMMSALYPVRDNTDVIRIPLLDAGPNECLDRTLPAPINMQLHRAERPAVLAYATTDAALYANPFQYQVLTRDLASVWASGSVRALSRVTIGQPEIVETQRHVIVLQDRFTFSNFAHFLFDGVTRALLLAHRVGSLRSSILVFGGVPGPYQEALSDALCVVLGLDADNIYFPDRPVILRPAGQCIWFSDQSETYLHPAQMAHPISIDLLRSVITAVPAPASEARRIYVSRGDAGRRRVVNEEQIFAALQKRGFVGVQLSRLPVAEQIGLFRDAEIVVAPHGMGLTHLAAADRLKGVVELHVPTTGTDAFACIAKAGGIDYQWVLGTVVDAAQDDFAVDLAQIMERVDAIEAGGSRPTWRMRPEAMSGLPVDWPVTP